MKSETEDDSANLVRSRRIVVSDDLPVDDVSHEVRGRRLENPPEGVSHEGSQKRNARKATLVRRPYVLGALVIGVVVIAGIGVLAMKKFNTQKVVAPARENIGGGGRPVAQPPQVATESSELRRLEEHAKQVMRRISRDSRPYSFNEDSLREIQTRARELSRSSQLSESLRQLQTQGEQIGTNAAKEGLQPSLVMLLGLALTHGGESGDCVNAASRAVPMLGTLNRTFGSTDGDSCLILVAAFREGPGTRRSHPLLRRINQVVTNPMTERNVWYLNKQNVLSAEAYALVVDTIAFGVITRNPREFGLDNEPLSF